MEGSHEDYPALIPMSLWHYPRCPRHIEVRAGADLGSAEAEPNPAKRLGESGPTGPGDCYQRCRIRAQHRRSLAHPVLGPKNCSTSSKEA
jgi:hypothetical protein